MNDSRVNEKNSRLNCEQLYVWLWVFVIIDGSLRILAHESLPRLDPHNSGFLQDFRVITTPISSQQKYWVLWALLSVSKKRLFENPVLFYVLPLISFVVAEGIVLVMSLVNFILVVALYTLRKYFLKYNKSPYLAWLMCSPLLFCLFLYSLTFLISYFSGNMEEYLARWHTGFSALLHWNYSKVTLQFISGVSTIIVTPLSLFVSLRIIRE